MKVTPEHKERIAKMKTMIGYIFLTTGILFLSLQLNSQIDDLVAYSLLNGNALDISNNGFHRVSVNNTLADDRFENPQSTFKFDISTETFLLGKWDDLDQRSFKRDIDNVRIYECALTESKVNSRYIFAPTNHTKGEELETNKRYEVIEPPIYHAFNWDFEAIMKALEYLRRILPSYLTDLPKSSSYILVKHEDFRGGEFPAIGIICHNEEDWTHMPDFFELHERVEQLIKTEVTIEKIKSKSRNIRTITWEQLKDLLYYPQ